MSVGAGPLNAMSVDVEEHFQVSAMEGHVDRATWHDTPSRVEANVDRVLELLDEVGARATFFTLGCLAERRPQMMRRIAQAGHEVASHGYAHVRVSNQSEAAFRADVARTKAILEDVTGRPVLGYRAASFSIDGRTPWAFRVLAETGHRYSSSTHPIRHDLYGDPNGQRRPFHPIAGSDFVEIPVATMQFGGRRWPCGGGGWFRLLPLAYSVWALKRLAEGEALPVVFYFHPWEIDAEQPRVEGLPWKARVRHYTNLGKMERKLRTVLTRFRWSSMDDVFLS